MLSISPTIIANTQFFCSKNLDNDKSEREGDITQLMWFHECILLFKKVEVFAEGFFCHKYGNGAYEHYYTACDSTCIDNAKMRG